MRIYAKDQSCGFRFTAAAWGAFSNFQPLAVPIAAGPWTFSTSEALYQSAKFATRPDIQQRFAEAPTARDAAATGRTPSLGIDPGWNAQRVDVMRWVLRMKREANAAAIDAVLADTGELPIVEVSARDPWWGARPVAERFEGRNVLGRLWMEAPPAASRQRRRRPLRPLAPPHPGRPPCRRHRSSARRPGGRLTAVSPPAHAVPDACPASTRAEAEQPAGRRPDVRGGHLRRFPAIRSTPMTHPDTISADYTLRPSELASTLALLVEARQPCVVWGPPGAAKSMIAQQVAADANRQYVDVRALLLDPVDLRGIPWRDGSDRTRWAPPAFLPPSDDPGLWLINLEELPSAVPMVQAALYQLVLDRKVGEYELPEGASLIACGNRESDRGVVHRMPTRSPRASSTSRSASTRRTGAPGAAANGIAAEVIFFVQLEPDLLHHFDPKSRERAFACPRTWHFASNIVQRRNGLEPAAERALFRGTIGEAAAVEFAAFLKVWRELPHPRAVINNPANADIPENASALMALCGSLYRLASDINFDSIVTYASWLNQVERWFGIITQMAIRRGSFSNVRELVNKIDLFVEHYNASATPFMWTATAESILTKLQRLCSYISGTPH